MIDLNHIILFTTGFFLGKYDEKIFGKDNEKVFKLLRYVRAKIEEVF